MRGTQESFFVCDCLLSAGASVLADMTGAFSSLLPSRALRTASSAPPPSPPTPEAATPPSSPPPPAAPTAAASASYQQPASTASTQLASPEASRSIASSVATCLLQLYLLVCPEAPGPPGAAGLPPNYTGPAGEVHSGRILSWDDRLGALQENGLLVDALALLLAFHEGTARSVHASRGWLACFWWLLARDDACRELMDVHTCPVALSKP